MKKSSQKPSSNPTWRHIQQTNPKGKTTKVARKRSLETLFKAGLLIFLVAAILAGGLGVFYLAESKPAQPSQAEPGTVDLVFKTDGVLAERWFLNRFGEILKTEVRQIDVSGLKSLLEKEGQVSSATVTLTLPSRLTVQVNEREPILRVRVRDGEGQATILLVARDGTLYQGEGYPGETLRRLPGTTGLKVRRLPGGYEPIKGMDSIARILDYTKENLPTVYQNWQVVDLRDWNPERDYRPSLVRVGSSEIEEMVFSTSGIERQIERLASILNHTQEHHLGYPKFIDLSYGEEAVIRYN